MKKKWIFIALGISLTALCSLHALIILDDAMSKHEQKKTGVSKLSRRQKLALENWLNETFILKTEAEKTESTPLSLSINIHKGKLLQLSDNSVWEIDPQDVKTTSGWITPVPIKLGSSKSLSYPYLLINATTGTAVKARLAPPPPPKKPPSKSKPSPSPAAPMK